MYTLEIHVTLKQTCSHVTFTREFRERNIPNSGRYIRIACLTIHQTSTYFNRLRIDIRVLIHYKQSRRTLRRGCGNVVITISDPQHPHGAGVHICMRVRTSCIFSQHCPRLLVSKSSPIRA